MANIHFAIYIMQALKLQWFRIAFLKNKSTSCSKLFTRNSSCLHANHMSLVFLAQNLLDYSLAHWFSIVVNKEYILTFIYIIFDRQEERILVQVVTENCKSRAMINALHTANALVVIYNWSCICARLCDCALRT